MELEMKKANLDAYEATGEIVLSQEETAETIVPDYCPDIARIIETSGMAFLHNRENRDGKVSLSGVAKISVLYTPEAEGGIRALEITLPFHIEGENHGVPECQYMIAEVEPELVETRMLNPRKVFARCKLIARITGYCKSNISFSEHVISSENHCVEMKQDLQQVSLLKEVSEKDFTFTDELGISPGKDGAEELLNSRFSWSVTETKVVGNKLIFKGIFVFCVLYRTAAGKYCSTIGELPFSQIMEIQGVSEHADVTVLLQPTGSDVQISGDDLEGRQLSVTLYLHATALLREPKEIALLTDMYSTAYEINYEPQTLLLTEYWDTINRRQMVREVLEIGVIADCLLSAAVHCGPVNISREGKNAVLRSTVHVQVLYLDEGNVPLLAERALEVSCSLETPDDCKLKACASCTEEVQGSLGERGIEVRFPVDFQIEMRKQVKKVCISAATLNFDEPKEIAGTPSLVLRCVEKQESAWDLAKRYNTTIAAILAANDLQEEPLPLDQLLLIPRKRG